MDVATVEKPFASYLEKYGASCETRQFLLAYIRLLLLFRAEISPKAFSVILERQKQLRGQTFDGHAFEDLRILSRSELNRHLGDNNESTREAMLNRLLFGALLDTDETDFFYLTEPMFEFVRKMPVSPVYLKQILESEFVGFNVDG